MKGRFPKESRMQTSQTLQIECHQISDRFSMDCIFFSNNQQHQHTLQATTTMQHELGPLIAFVPQGSHKTCPHPYVNILEAHGNVASVNSCDGICYEVQSHKPLAHKCKNRSQLINLEADLS